MDNDKENVDHISEGHLKGNLKKGSKESLEALPSSKVNDSTSLST